MNKNNLSIRIGVGLIALLFAGVASALTIKYDIGPDNGAVPGFGSSFIHGAGCSSTQYCMSGTKFSITGELILEGVVDDAGNIVSITGASGSVTGSGGTGSGSYALPSDDYTMNFLGAQVYRQTDPRVEMPNGDDLLMTLDYEIVNDEQTVVDNGVFYFADKKMTSGTPFANTLSLTNLILWGNNWPASPDSRNLGSSSYKLGTDLYGVGTVVPLPPAIWLFGSALAGLFGFRKFNMRKRHCAADA